MTSSSAEDMPQPPRRRPVSLDKLARQQDVRPVESVVDMAQDGVFDSDEDLEAFLAHVYASRQADFA